MIPSVIGLRAFVYKAFAKWVSIWVRSHVKREQILDPDRIPFKNPIWFHAASAGEWESLAPVARNVLQQNPRIRICCTVFSTSGYSAIKKFEAELSGQVVAGLSPTEGHWSAFVKKLKPAVLVTAKYEAWPELWMACSEQQVPLWILGAIPRSSLVWVRRILRLLGVRLPVLTLFFPLLRDQNRLQQLFPDATLKALEETRWDQVVFRGQVGSTKVQELLESVVSLPRPWGVLGSFWESDLPVFKRILEQLSGTLFVFPHDVSRSNKHWVSLLSSFQKTRVFETGLIERDSRIVVVNQVGYLAEFYAHADWAYIGGGFEKGVHSTIEPAIHGLPMACGPKNMTRFPEIEALRDTGQLTVIQSNADATGWFLKLQRLKSEARTQWKLRNHARLGASTQVASELGKEWERQAKP